MIKKVILATTVIAGLCGVGAVMLHPNWLPGHGPSSVVRERAKGYWNARVAGDSKQLAPFVHPLQTEAQDNSMLQTESYEITKVEVNGDNATVGIKATYHVKMAQMTSIKREVDSEDHWVRYKDQWYHALHPVGFGEVLAQGLGKWKPPTAPPKPAAPKQLAAPTQPEASIATP